MREFNIGIKTKEQILGWKDVASDRIRATMIAEQFPETMEIWKDDAAYNNIIFHEPDWPELDRLKKRDGKSVLDICDLTWEDNGDVLEFANVVNVVSVSSQPLKTKLETVCKTPIVVIEDGHNINDRMNKWHNEKVGSAVWFGYAENFSCMIRAGILETLQENGVMLRIIAQHPISEWLGSGGEEIGYDFVKWDVNTVCRDINECDIAVLPKNGPYKTNNKDITAWLCGLPVAKSRDDVLALMAKDERLKQLSKVDFREFDIKKIAIKYFNLCAGLWSTKKRVITL